VEINSEKTSSISTKLKEATYLLLKNFIYRAGRSPYFHSGFKSAAQLLNQIGQE
jgi:hypothetical protein